jgi:hypothetical protein
LIFEFDGKLNLARQMGGLARAPDRSADSMSHRLNVAGLAVAAGSVAHG